jgi:hypothetical protein
MSVVIRYQSRLDKGGIVSRHYLFSAKDIDTLTLHASLKVIVAGEG